MRADCAASRFAFRKLSLIPVIQPEAALMGPPASSDLGAV